MKRVHAIQTEKYDEKIKNNWEERPCQESHCRRRGAKIDEELAKLNAEIASLNNLKKKQLI